jgi:uncharacterized membrane protein YeiH
MSEATRATLNRFLITLDLLGTAFFAAEGASVGIQAHLDLLGVLVFSYLSSAGGGILRDLLIGDSPPAAIKNWRYPATSIVAGTAAFAFHTIAPNINPLVATTLDGAGHAFYSIAGAMKALEFGLHPLPAILMAGISGVGGGVIRDVLMMRVPTVLTSDFYASASLIGGTVTILALRTKMPTRAATWCGIVVCFVLRMMAVYFHWHLPRI